MTNDQIRTYIDEHSKAWLDELMDWLRIPSVSADPDRAPAVAQSAEWLAEAFRRTGFPVVEIWPTSGLPAVFAEWSAEDPNAPTVVVYGHHDVQPVDPLDLWTSPPFEPVLVGEDLLGRGSADDKGQVAFHLLGLRALMSVTGATAPPVTLKFLIEGEEESGSPNFRQLMLDNLQRLTCDVAVVSDTGMWSREIPTICTGMRGMASCQLDVTGPDGDLHSGSFGGAVPNPLKVLAQMLSELHDDEGRVTLPGFYDRVVELSDRERALIAKLSYDEATWLTTAQSRAVTGEAGWSTLERLWARPTAEVNGMWGGYTGPGHKTIIPSHAHAKLSFRLVSNQDPVEVADQVRQWVADHTPPGITSELTFEGDGVRPCLTPLDAPALQAAAASLGRAFDSEVLFTREGGSGPEADIADVLSVPVVFLGVGLPDDRIHAPNERAVFPLLLKGAEAMAYLWDTLAGALADSA